MFEKFIKNRSEYGVLLFEQTFFALQRGTEVFILRPEGKSKTGAHLESAILTMDLREAERIGYKILTAREVLNLPKTEVNKPLFTMRLAEELVANS